MYQKLESNVDIQVKIKNRLNFLYTSSMGLAYLLTPRHAATGYFFEDDKIDIMSSVEEFSCGLSSEIAVRHKNKSYRLLKKCPCFRRKKEISCLKCQQETIEISLERKSIQNYPK
ncbi:hypothetical protein ACKWTF_005233 [Chironomus riparius]